jgi:hypothetical protein
VDNVPQLFFGTQLIKGWFSNQMMQKRQGRIVGQFQGTHLQ